MDLPKQAKMTRESTMSICANLNQLECDDSKEPTTPPKPNSRQKGFESQQIPSWFHYPQSASTLQSFWPASGSRIRLNTMVYIWLASSHRAVGKITTTWTPGSPLSAIRGSSRFFPFQLYRATRGETKLTTRLAFI